MGEKLRAQKLGIIPFAGSQTAGLPVTGEVSRPALLYANRSLAFCMDPEYLFLL